ncbi:MAG: carbohydrate ABC transporter permease [Candidatus Humimicrobiaceae bacterium]
MKIKLKESVLGYFFVAPAVIFCILFLAYPFIQSIILAFFKWDGVTNWQFIGINNFIELFTKERFFYKALSNTLMFTILSSLGMIMIGFILAILIDMKILFWKIYRFVFFLSNVLSFIVLAFLFLKILAPQGLINSILEKFGVEAIIWLDAKKSIFIIIAISIWQGSGLPMIFFLAGLKNIQKEIYESAMIDGASTVRRVFTISVPLLKNVFLTLIVMLLIFNFKVFDIVWAMSQGGPYGSTEVLGTLLYKNAFQELRFGYASSIGFIMIIISGILAFFYVKYSGYGSSIQFKKKDKAR